MIGAPPSTSFCLPHYHTLPPPTPSPLRAILTQACSSRPPDSLQLCPSVSSRTPLTTSDTGVGGRGCLLLTPLLASPRLPLCLSINAEIVQGVICIAFLFIFSFFYFLFFFLNVLTFKNK